MRYGHYVITLPDTPLPWINYPGCESYFGIISNTAGATRSIAMPACSASRATATTTYLDGGGRYIYLRDDDIGEFWSPSWKPTCHELEGYTCGHGLGFTIISSTYKKIETETRYFIPWGESGEGV